MPTEDFLNEDGEFYAKLGKNVRSAREDKGITQEALASLVRLTRSSVANIERGRQKMLAHTVVRVADALSVSTAELLPPPAPRVAGELDELLRGRTPTERDWIATALQTRQGKSR
jgi:transcriptional regulator with XRE-family HTH domain